MGEHRDSLETIYRDVLGLPADASAWLLQLWDAIQAFDDVADGDKVERSDLDAVIWGTLVGMPTNQWYAENAMALSPLVAVMVLKWQASDWHERNGTHNAVSFAWRAGYYDVVLAAVTIAHGPQRAVELAPMVMGIYGERFEEYLEEFGNA